jgi:hypothetical protein
MDSRTTLGLALEGFDCVHPQFAVLRKFAAIIDVERAFNIEANVSSPKNQSIFPGRNHENECHGVRCYPLWL